MYKIYDKLSDEELKALTDLAREVRFKDSYGNRVRIGRNKEKALSIYNYAKWFDWTAAQRETFRKGFTPEVINKTISAWFLDIPAGTGFLDIMDTWVDKPNAGTIVCTALKDNQSLYLGGRLVELNAGEQLSFHLSTVHSIPKSAHGQLWACVMIRGNYADFN